MEGDDAGRQVEFKTADLKVWQETSHGDGAELTLGIGVHGLGGGAGKILVDVTARHLLDLRHNPK